MCTTWHNAASCNLHDHSDGFYFVQACLAVANEDSYRGVLRALRSKLVKLPKVHPSPDSPSPSRSLVKLLTEATKQQKSAGHSYLGVDTVLKLLVDHVRSSAVPPESSGMFQQIPCA